MKTKFAKSTVLALVMLSAVGASFGAGKNLVIGVGQLNNNGQWSNFSALNLIPGTAIMPISSKTAAFYLAFTAGTEADISNMVLYKTTARNSRTIASVIPVTRAGISNPSILLSDKTVCKTRPPSPSHPCIVRLDLLTISLSPTNDYWLVIYFAGGANNQAVGGGQGTAQGGSLTGFFVQTDDTHLNVGDSIPDGNFGRSNFLRAVATN